MSDEARVEEDRAGLRYLCYLEAYTEARCGCIVTARKIIDLVMGDEDEEVFYNDTTLARAVAYGASDGAHACPKPMGPLAFERFVRDHDERDAAEAAGERSR